MMDKIDRRAFIRSVTAGTAGLALSGFSTEQKKPAIPKRDDRPNIVLIMADDLGFSDVGAYGSEIRTAYLDRLAAGGIRFTQFYNDARCCPTRASLLTGLYPHQAGIGHMTSEDKATLSRNQKIGLPQYQGYLNDRCVNIAEVLRSSGYQTFMTGKWHVGTYRPNWPVDRGFERYFGIVRGAANYFHPDPEKLLLLDDEPVVPGKGFYTTDAFSDRAASFIRESDRNRPFFLYVAFNAPHWPLHAWPEDIARYRGTYLEGWDVLRDRRFRRQKALGLFNEGLALSPRDVEAPLWKDAEDKQAWDLRMAVYAAQVDRMDQGIGRILEAVRETGKEKNTLVLFLSDNGGCAEPYEPKPGIPPGPAESDTAYHLPWANLSNTPFRLFKHWVHEGGISSPCIAYWPAVIRKGGSVTTQMGHVMDLMPTFLEMAGADYPTTYRGRDILPPAGKSLLPVFQGREREGYGFLCWEHEGNRAVRQGPWKLVSYYNDAHQRRVGAGKRTGPWELYNLETDRTELRNLAASMPDKVNELSTLYETWARSIGVADWEDIQQKLSG